MGSAKLTHYIVSIALAWSHLSVTEAKGTPLEGWTWAAGCKRWEAS